MHKPQIRKISMLHQSFHSNPPIGIVLQHLFQRCNSPFAQTLRHFLQTATLLFRKTLVVYRPAEGALDKCRMLLMDIVPVYFDFSLFMRPSGGVPRTAWMRDSWSISSFPGNRGFKLRVCFY